MLTRNQLIWCPLCQVGVDRNLQRVQLSLGFPEVEGLYLENQDLRRKLENAEATIDAQRNEIDVLRQRLEGENGARIRQPQRIYFNFCLCFNCKSETHATRDCQQFSLLRFYEFSPGTTLRRPGTSFFITFAYNDRASVVVRQMEKILDWDIYHRQLTRNEVLVAFAVTFFHRVCWRCYAYTQKEEQCPETNLWNPFSDVDDCEEMKRILLERWPDLR